MSDKLTKLEPCPFCDGEAVLENTVTEAQVRCKSCNARIKRPHAAREDTGVPSSIAAWNRRRSQTEGEVTVHSASIRPYDLS